MPEQVQSVPMHGTRQFQRQRRPDSRLRSLRTVSTIVIRRGMRTPIRALLSGDESNTRKLSNEIEEAVSYDTGITAVSPFTLKLYPRARDMTETLAEKKCTPCRGGIPPLTHAEAERFQSQTPNWELRDDAHRIERTFRFRNFQEALGFVRNVGDLAETEGHHPDISFGWGYATISLRTKKIKGLHENDFIMASKLDRMFDRPDGPPDHQ
jgi:4a-hydroxytetrahydrobiopterin dehydratase